MELLPRERKQLSHILDCTEDELDHELEKVSAAATEEYVRMALGQRVFTRGQDIREYRLFLLIRHVFGGRLPSDREISAVFQTGASQSRALLRAVMSKYQYELQDEIDATLAQALDAATQKPDSNSRIITIDSEGVVEALNRRLAGIDGTLPQIVRVRNTISSFEIAPSAYQALTR